MLLVDSLDGFAAQRQVDSGGARSYFVCIHMANGD
jgi:hypothetical protein